LLTTSSRPSLTQAAAGSGGAPTSHPSTTSGQVGETRSLCRVCRNWRSKLLGSV
jgi:hypothetical protein